MNDEIKLDIAMRIIITIADERWEDGIYMTKYSCDTTLLFGDVVTFDVPSRLGAPAARYELYNYLKRNL